MAKGRGVFLFLFYSCILLFLLAPFLTGSGRGWWRFGLGKWRLLLVLDTRCGGGRSEPLAEENGFVALMDEAGLWDVVEEAENWVVTKEDRRALVEEAQLQAPTEEADPWAVAEELISGHQDVTEESGFCALAEEGGL